MATSYPHDGPAPILPLDLSHHYAKATRHRGDNNLKRFYKFFAIPGIANFAGGLPNVALFPYDTLEAQIAKPDRWEPTPNHPKSSATAKPKAAKPDSDPIAASHITVPKIDEETDLSKKIDLATALQYGQAMGYPPLASFIRQFTREHLHPNVPYVGGPETIPTVGSTDGFNKVVEMIVDPWFPEEHAAEDRPHMLCEVFVYPAVLNQTVHKGVRPVPVEIDGEGMMADGPGGLREILENWDPRNGKRPHFMYSVTMGHNPTSGVLSMERRKAIYELCCKYDIIIVEDDPYWYMQFPSAVEAEARSRDLPIPMSKPAHQLSKSSGYDFLDSLVPSYLNIDIEGRVIRLDTFSKTIAPGCRMGWITAQPRFIAALSRITETLTQQPSGFVQSMVAETVMGKQPETVTSSFFSLSSREKLTFNGWSMDGWVRWLEGLRGVYERRMNRMCTILDEHSFQLKQSTPVKQTDADWGVITKTRLMSFDWPRGGMFLWLRVHFENHPLWQTKGKKIPVFDGPQLSLGLFILLTHKPYLVLAAPGGMFSANTSVAAERGWQYVRVCFAAEAEDVIDPASERFGKGVQKFWKIKADEMEELIEEWSASGASVPEGLTDLGYNAMGC